MNTRSSEDDLGWACGQLARRGRAVAGLERAARDLVAAASRVTRCLREGGKVLVFGNGGSAAQAQHLAGEFLGRYDDEREGLAAVALTADGAVLSGLANDFGFGSVFARQVEALGRPGDVAVAISTSGASPSTVAGAAAARSRGLATVGMVGLAPSPLHELVDVAVVTPAPTTAHIQELQLVACHVLCELVERALYPHAALAGRPIERAILTVPDLLRERERWRAVGQSVVWTNGCFDLLHAGHVRMLRGARALGDVLVVGVNDDDSVRRLKGPGRPVVPLDDRIEVLLALETVERVVVLEGDDPTSLLAELQPDVHCKGGDYRADARPMPERATVEGAGGVVHVLDYWEGRSTTAIVDRIERWRPHGR